jgi:hypothetical protein
MMVNKRGADILPAANQIAVLLLLMVVVIVGFIVLMPPEDRDALLGEDSGSTDNDGTSGTSNLLTEYPGELDSSSSSTQVKELDPIRIYSTIETDSTTLANSLKISRSLIQNNYKSITFDLDNLDELDELSVVFLITESKGDLNVKLNGNVVYEGELSSSELPLILPTNYLFDNGNIIEFSSSFPGWNIFSADYYLLQDVSLVEEYLVEETSKERTFYVSDISDLKSAELSYFITCNDDEEGMLQIYLNNRQVFNDNVFCEYLDGRELGLSISDLSSYNTLRFEIDDGDYNIEEIEIEFETKGSNYPTYSFDIDSDLYDQIETGEKEIYLELSFSDDSSEKKASVYVQDYSFTFDTNDDEYQKKISSYVDSGVNVIKVVPTRDIDVDVLKVYSR